MPTSAEVYRRIKRYFLTGLFVLFPVALTVLVVVWLVRAVDALFGFRLPGMGLLVTMVLVVLLGLLMSSVLGKQAFELLEEVLLHVPGVRAVYKTLKAMTDVFSPESPTAFRHVVLVEYPQPGSLALGFVTSETSLTRGGASERRLAVYVPTNHLYLGNTVVVPPSKVVMTSLSVPEGVQIVLSGGAGFPAEISAREP
jgi:uncharacterized membrane protein